MSPSIANIPCELLLQIFLFLQPVYSPVFTGIFEQDFPFTERWTPTPTSKEATKYHPTIHLSRGKPILLRLGQVSRQFRQAVGMHPFFYSLQFYLLAPFPSEKQFHLTAMLSLSQFIQAISRSYGRKLSKKIETVSICCSTNTSNKRRKVTLLVQDVLSLLSSIRNPLCVKNLVISLNWLALQDSNLTKTICLFENLERLYLRGVLENDILNGYDNTTLKAFEKSFSRLTHLFIDGFGPQTFTWKRLKRLLERNPNLKHLTLNGVRGVVDLQELSAACPNLTHLTVHLKAEERFLEEEVDVIEALRIRRNIMLGITFTGDFSNSSFPKLEQLVFYEEDVTAWISVDVIRRLLKTIPLYRFGPTNAFSVYQPVDSQEDLDLYGRGRVYCLLPL